MLLVKADCNLEQEVGFSLRPTESDFKNLKETLQGIMFFYKGRFCFLELESCVLWLRYWEDRQNLFICEEETSDFTQRSVHL